MAAVDVRYDFDIVDIAKRLGLRIQDSNNTNKKEVVATCPFHDDKKYHLSLNRYGNVFRCNKCGASGGILHLVAYMKGIDNKEAFRLLTEGSDLGSGLAPLSKVEKEKKIIAQNTENHLKSIDGRNQVYNELLDRLTLSDKHRSDLIKRGLPKQIINSNKYKSIPNVPEIRKSICNSLMKQHDLFGIPGFFTDKYREWDFYSSSGLLIPVKDIDKKIQGLQVRLDNPGNGGKYRYFSSTDRDNGTSAESWVHIAGKPKKKVCLTEGPLKGDIANYFSGETFVAIPGINSTKYLERVLIEMDVRDAINDFDMDRYTNLEVKKGVQKIKDMLSEIKIKVTDDTWDSKYKGIDDYLFNLSKNKFTF